MTSFSGWRVVALAASVVILATGCTAAAPPAPDGTSPAPTAEVVAYERPAQVFGGECANVATAAEIGAILGSAPKDSGTYDRVGSPAVAYDSQFGGLTCTWVTASQDSGIIATILPEGAVTLQKPECFPHGIEAGGTTSCTLEATDDGIVLSGLLWGSVSDAATLAATDALRALFAEKATTDTAIPLPTLAEGSWAHPADCVDTLESTELPGLTGTSAEWIDLGYTDAYWSGAMRALWGSSVQCGDLADDGTSATGFEWLGGGRWAEDHIRDREGATELEIEGVELAIQSPGAADLPRLDVFDGANWLTVTPFDADTHTAAVQALVAELDRGE